MEMCTHSKHFLLIIIVTRAQVDMPALSVKVAEEAGVEPTGHAYVRPNGFENRVPHRGYISSLFGLRAKYNIQAFWF